MYCCAQFSKVSVADSLAEFLGVKNSASQDDINKAFRKKSRLIHPDKAKQSFIASKAKATPKSNILGQKKKPGVHVSKGPTDGEIRNAVKKASERFARLGVIANILKGPGRERYDHFLSNGFPKWKGTGYYYARFRPGLWTVLVGLFVMGGGVMHYCVLYLSWKRQIEFVKRYIQRARREAWGEDSAILGIPGVQSSEQASVPLEQEDGGFVLNRRQKRLQEKESKKEKEKKKGRGTRSGAISTSLESDTGAGPQGRKKRVQAENGKILIVDSVGNVFLEEEGDNGGKEEYLLDPDEILKPTIRQTLVVRLPTWVYTNVKRRFFATKDASREEADASSENEDSEKGIDPEPVRKATPRRHEKRNGNTNGKP